MIRALSCRAEANVLGRSFQGAAAVRRITEEDHRILCQAARDLALEPWVRILPEERLEATILVGDTGAVDALVRQERPGIAERRVAYLCRQAPTRSRQLVNELQEM